MTDRMDDTMNPRNRKRRKTSHEESGSPYMSMLQKVESKLQTSDIQKLAQMAKLNATGVVPGSQSTLHDIRATGLFSENNLSWLEEALMKIHNNKAANIVCGFAYGRDESDQDVPSEPESVEGDVQDNKSMSFEEFLKLIGLEGKITKKLTLTEFLTVKDYTKSEKTLFLFWQKITSLDCRSVISQNFLPSNVSMRDYIFSILNCANDFLRQDILEKLSACQFAVPVLLQGCSSRKSEVLIWGCGRIVKKWKGVSDKFAFEKPIINHPTFVVSVLRIGNIALSKSQILNRMLSVQQGYGFHPFFLNKENDIVRPTFSLGCVESIWFLPTTGTDNEIFKSAITFLNLRGDVTKFPEQTMFACKAANLTIVMVGTSSRKEYVNYIRKIEKASLSTIFIAVKEIENLTDAEREQDQEPAKKNNWLFVKTIRTDSLEKKLCTCIYDACCETQSHRTLKTIDYNQFDTLDTDEQILEKTKAEDFVEEIFKSIPYRNVQQFKQQSFPLQVFWQEWVKLDKARFETDNTKQESFEQQRSKTLASKKQKREVQLSVNFSKTMQIYYKTIKDAKSSQNMLQYFLGFLEQMVHKLVIDEINSDIKLETYKDARNSVDVINEKTCYDHDKDSPSGSLDKVKYNQGRIRRENLGCEHFLREMGQLYEAYKDVSNKHAFTCDTSEIPLFPTVVATLISHMYPLELMDGDTGCIPITWVTAILDKMSADLQNPKVLVISVVGVQSSGKSTFLNSMFGLRFPVRAGRCTRGLFARFLKIEEKLAEELGFMYFIIVDTEGIKSIDHDDHRFDNELVTFALSIANVTIFNISGENIGPDVAGILQIAAHALMRMKEVDLECRCKIIQQRVSDLTAADRNKANTDKIKETLDEATKFAAEEEGLEGRYKKFSDVVDLNFDEDLQYVPSLWTGGMAPPNHMYGEKVTKIREGLLRDIRNKIITPDLTLSTFTDRVRDVWSAVKEENFVFNFKDSVRAVDFNQFCLHYNEWIVQMRQAIMDKTNDCIGGVASAVYKGNSAELLITPLEDEVERQSELLRDLVEKYVLDHPRKSMISRHKRGFLEDVHIAVKDARQQAQQRITEEYEIKKLEHNLPNLGPKWLVRMINDVKEVASTRAVTEELRHLNTFDDDELDELWKKWTRDIKQESGITQIQISPSDVKTLCDKLLLRMTRDMAIGSDIHNLLSKEGGIEKHIELSDCSKYINDKQVKAWIKNRATTRKEDKGASERESETPENEIIQYEKQKAIDTMIQSIESSIDELKGQTRKHFDRNVFQLLVRKTLKNLSKKTEGDIKLPNSLIAKGLMHLCGRAFNEVFKYTEVSDDNYSTYFYREYDIVRNTFHNFIGLTQSNVEYNISEVLYYYIKEEFGLWQEYEHFIENFDYSKLTKRLSLPWDVLEYESRDVIDHEWEDSLFYPCDIMAWSDDYCEYLLPTDTEDKELDKLRVPVLGELTELENNLDHNDPYQDWIGRLLDTFDIDSSVRRTDDIYDNPRPLEVSRNLKERINKWDPREEHDSPELDRSSLKIAAGLSNVCKETCPMCGMFCDNIMKSHAIHSSHLHRPRGMAYETYLGTNRLVLEDCSSSILLPNTMCTITGKVFHCKDYKQYYPDWDILPSTNDPGKLFWQWIFNKGVLMGYYYPFDAEFPTSWHNITKENALQSLMDDKQLKTEMRTNHNQHTKDDSDEQKLVADEEDDSDSEESKEADSVSSNSSSDDESESSSDDES